ncbi:MAG: 6-carboxytetrahydropterin synthase [Flavobacteriia bacterium]|mgnify:CR=1 FL=1|nr:6-carboxytetrahydropterin synthase [Flavobacteriia bacterium]OJX36159.1 MAG: 6-pyruvoyl tetrahydrobiopterin synthase [Flavobacteriia bacterium 40-80]
MKICRRETFNAAHRLYNPDFDEATNQRIYDKCSNPNYHGHNYVLEVWVEGQIDAETGYLIDLKTLSDVIHEEVLERFDHRNLNLDCPEFSNLIPTVENIAVVIWDLLKARIDAKYGLEIRLWETDKNSVWYNGK